MQLTDSVALISDLLAKLFAGSKFNYVHVLLVYSYITNVC